MTKNNPSERRRLKRHAISYYLPVLDADTLHTVGHLVDINQIGLLLDCISILEKGSVHKLRIDTPPGASDRPCINFTARVKWCQMDRIQPNTFNTGFEITDISKGDAEVIKQIADMYGSH